MEHPTPSETETKREVQHIQHPEAVPCMSLQDVLKKLRNLEEAGRTDLSSILTIEKVAS